MSNSDGIEVKHAATGFYQEAIYGAILFVCFILGFAFTKIKAGLTRRIASGLSGFVLVIITSQYQTIHSFIPILLAYVSIKIFKSKADWVVFSTTLLYLLFFRLAHGLFPTFCDQNSPFANAVQLLTTLRVISYGFEHSSPKNFTSFLDMFCYIYCYVGLFTGPFYRKSMFDDYCENENLDKIPVKTVILEKLKFLPPSMILYVVLKDWFPKEFFMSPEYVNNQSVFQNLMYLQVIFAWCRYRFYMAWICAEVVCMSSRLGAYRVERKARPGLGPSLPEPEPSDNKVEYNFNAVWNIKIMSTEFNPSIRQVMRDWNTSVQWWLANYTYKKVPRNVHISLRMAFTMFVSAYWHGIAPGYFMGFLCVPFIGMVEDLVTKAFKEDFPMVYTYSMYLNKHVSFSMTGIAFMLLDYSHVMNCWRAAGFAIFWVNGLLAAVSLVKIKAFGGMKKIQKVE